MYQKELEKRAQAIANLTKTAKRWHALGVPWHDAVKQAKTLYRKVWGEDRDNQLARSVVQQIAADVQRAYEAEGFTGPITQFPLTQKVQNLRQMSAVKALVDKTFEQMATAGPNVDEDAFASLSVNRARFYAKNETGIVTGALQKASAQKTGAIGFVWLRTRSAHPREDHLENVGKFFRFNEYTGELPGELYNCKCSMKPIYDANSVKE